MSENISIITLIPVSFVIIMIVLVFSISTRENITELIESLTNISSIESLK